MQFGPSAASRKLTENASSDLTQMAEVMLVYTNKFNEFSHERYSFFDPDLGDSKDEKCIHLYQ